MSDDLGPETGGHRTRLSGGDAGSQCRRDGSLTMQVPSFILSPREVRARFPNQPGFGPRRKGTSYRTPEDNDGPMRLFFTASIVLFFVILFASFLLMSSPAQDAASANTVLTQAWSRATPSGSKVAGADPDLLSSHTMK